MTGPDFNSLQNRFADMTARIGIIGMGYVGLPLALACVKSGFFTTGFDVDETKVKALVGGRSYLKHISGSHIKEAVEGGKLDATADFSRLDEMDAILICVPTPLAPGNVPDL
ncbi:MAG: nucleotide sugar dehydrogenase, partial [Rhodospirillales bacterium]|nr:nucleotide sugar dehydrogenase [Rhodospirillales bacterium]